MKYLTIVVTTRRGTQGPLKRTHTSIAILTLLPGPGYDVNTSTFGVNFDRSAQLGHVFVKRTLITVNCVQLIPSCCGEFP